MRKTLAVTLLLSASLTVSGCVDDHTGDVGHKNIRPYYRNDYDRNGVIPNGTYSVDDRGLRTRFADDQATKMNRANGDAKLENYVTSVHGNHHIEWSNSVANQLAAMPEVDSAYVMLTDRNAYVAIVENNRNRTNARSAGDSGALHDKIADQVRAMSPMIQNVYVSSNPDFVGRMSNYANAIGRGEPVQGFLTEFNAMVQRVFPSVTRTTDSMSSGLSSGPAGRPRGRYYGTYGTHRSYGPFGAAGWATNR